MLGNPLKRPASEPKPPAVPGFDAIQRYWDPGTLCWMAKILPGEFYVTRCNEAVTTVLGSCISACIRDPLRAVGGMNHFMLPEEEAGGQGAWQSATGGASTRYGSHAMESLINELLKLGAERNRLEVKLFGGGHILPSMTDIGLRNIAFARSYLKMEGLTLAAQDVGAAFPRRIIFYPSTGRVLVKHLRAVDCGGIASLETRYRNRLGDDFGNDVELFN